MNSLRLIIGTSQFGSSALAVALKIRAVRSLFIVMIFAGLLAVTAIAPSGAGAQEKYPSRPVRIIHSLPAGSSPDVRIRILAEHLTKMWGQQVVVENRP